MTLRLPSDLSAVSPLSCMSAEPFPPRGFAAFEVQWPNNGDIFGLYWPIGTEDQEPLVCEIVPEGSMVPAFSGLSAFLRLTDSLDGAEHPGWPSLKDDEHSPYACFATSREAAAAGSLDEACALLRRAVERLPEYAAALSLLTAHCLRLGKHDEACRFAVRALRSPPTFGYVGADLRKTWNWLSRQARGPDDLAEDPIWLRRTALEAPPTGGSKYNDVYPALAEAAAEYAAQGDIGAALSLWQAYGEFISGETVSFRERYSFTVTAHRERLRSIEAHLPAGLRELALSLE